MADRNEQTMISFKVDSVVKESAEAVLTGSGLSTSAYLGMCLRKLAQGGEVPFDLKVDSMFWIGEAKVSKAATYIKSGAFHEALAIQSEVGKLFEMEISEFLIKLACDDGTDEVTRVASKNLLTNGSIPLASTSISLIRSYVDRVALLTGSSGHPSADDLASGIRDIANQAGERAASLFGKSKILDLSEEPTVGNDVEGSAWNVELVDSIVATVLDTYEKNRGQLAMRFVGSEFGIEEVEQASNRLDKLAERVQQKIDSDNDREFENSMAFIKALKEING